MDSACRASASAASSAGRRASVTLSLIFTPLSSFPLGIMIAEIPASLKAFGIACTAGGTTYIAGAVHKKRAPDGARYITYSAFTMASHSPLR